MKETILKMRHWQRGLLFGFILFAVLFACDLVSLVREYTGKCGDLVNKNANTYACSLRDYMLNDPYYGMYHGVNAKLTWLTYGAMILFFVFVFSLYGFWKKKKSALISEGGF